MADRIVVGNRPCIKCGSLEKNSNGDCRPCQLKCSSEWKKRHKAQLLASGEPLFYTYVHISPKDGKVFYVGKGCGGRAYAHKNRNIRWHRVVEKHGIMVEIVERFHSEADAFNHEIHLIKKYKSIGEAYCNFTSGGEGPAGLIHSEETRKKISELQIGKKLTLEHRKKLSIAGKGRVVTEYTRAKISKAKAGRKMTPEQIRINSESHKGQKLTPERKEALRQANLGKPKSEETKARIRARHKGKRLSDEVKRKIGLANKGRKHSEEAKAKIGAAHRGRKRPQEVVERIRLSNIGKTRSQETRQKIAASLLGRKQPGHITAKIKAAMNSLECKAKMSASRKGKPWTDARRLAYENRKLLDTAP